MRGIVSPISDTGGMVKKDDSKASRKVLGAIYTPESMALWLARHVRQLGFTPEVVVDPAAGDGVLLKSAQRIFPHSQAVAFEVDFNSHQSLKKFWPNRNSKARDSLLISTWIPKKTGPVLIFSNPPWGATISTDANIRYRKNFQSATGFYDLYDLFLEKSIVELPNGSWGAFFLPDSILQKQHSAIRKLLLETTQIKSVTRLPEGVFEGVAMGSIAIVFRKGSPRRNSCIRISRLSRLSHNRCKNNSQEIWKEINKNVHYIYQKQWQLDANSNWSMEFKGAGVFFNELSIFKKIENCESTWDKWFVSGRGFEIGKKASVLINQKNKSSIARQRRVAVGEDLNRLVITPSRSIRLDLDAFNYKSELLDEERILVRKTGIGLKAVVASGISTTQTIYHFFPKKNVPDYALHYAAGFLISRVIIALHLAKTGEIEWRSHPYVTQKTIRDLNLPIPRPGSQQENLAREIATISKTMHEKGSRPELEKKLDQLVCQIIGGQPSLLNWAYEFLSDIKGCTYTKSLIANLKFDSQVA